MKIEICQITLDRTDINTFWNVDCNQMFIRLKRMYLFSKTFARLIGIMKLKLS